MKRADIQGLRTVSILAVIFYHIWPTHFPNGFLGVDVFFVISGHLMAVCLANFSGKCCGAKSDKIRNKLFQFYARRVKRIVPMYVAVICGTLSVSRTIMLDSDFQKARFDMYWALAFVANIQPVFENNDYFAEVFSYRPFLHCWSLGVEMQFYLLAPLAMLLLLSLRGLHRRLLRHFFCSTVLLASVIVQQLLTTVMPALSFGLMFCRLWQFFAGILVHFFNTGDQQNEKEANETAETVDQIGWPYVLGHGQQSADQENAINSAISLAPIPAQNQAINASPSTASSPPPVPPFSNASLSIPSSSLSSLAAGQKQQQQQQQEAEEVKNNLVHFLWRSAAAHLLLFLLLCVLFAPIGVPSIVVPFQNTFAVILAAAQLHVHHQQRNGMTAWPASPLLTNFLAVQLGDLSYIWWVVHWPVIVFIKYFFTRIATEKDNDGSLGQRSVTLDTNFTKMIINELQNVESRKRLVNTLSLYEKIKLNELLQSATFEDRYKILPGEERTERWTKQLKQLLVQEGNKTPQNLLKFVIDRKVKGTGNGTVLLVGNSHADVVARELGEEMNAYYHDFQVFTMPGCMPIAMPEHLIPFDPGHIIPCPFFTRTVRNIVEQTKPDVVFMVFRWYNEVLNAPFNENGTTKNDEILKAFRHELRHFQKFVSNRIFVSAPTLQFKHDVAKELAKRLWQHAPLGDLQLSLREHYVTNRFSYARLRLLNCPKCVQFDLAEHFCDARTDKCAAFDEQIQLANFFDNNHLSYLGRQSVRPFLRAIGNQIWHDKRMNV
ncbi:hypothetical protein niasHS_007741 [Heterodera schachtii]|uniref:Acyl_transf_3 domain-containing protein n=1 Tax=Heterodera schachtii TaxID=97005 RepID=A0ABD2JPJ1_HETSC